MGHSQLISPDKDYFFKVTPGIDEKQASVTGNTTKQSVSGGEKNLVLLQEKEEKLSEETNYDADVNAEANEINDQKKDTVAKIKKEKNTF